MSDGTPLPPLHRRQEAAAGIGASRWKVFTLPVALLGRRIGALGERDRDAVRAGLATVLG